MSETPYKVEEYESPFGKRYRAVGPEVSAHLHNYRSDAVLDAQLLNAAHAQGKREGLAGAEDVRAVMQEYIDSVDKMDFVNASDCISYTKRLMIAALSSLAPTTGESA